MRARVFIEKVSGGHAVVTCLEAVRAAGKAKRKGMEGVTMHATNVFVRAGGKWQLAHHHASPVPPLKAKPVALQTALATLRTQGNPLGGAANSAKKSAQNSTRPSSAGGAASSGGDAPDAMSITWSLDGEGDEDEDEPAMRVTLKVVDEAEEDMSPQGGVTVAFDEHLLKALDGPRSRGDLDGAVVTMGQVYNIYIY